MLRKVENAQDEDDVSYIRKAMVGSGMSLNLNYLWKVRELFFHIQIIVENYGKNFEGNPVAEILKLNSEIPGSEKE